MDETCKSDFSANSYSWILAMLVSETTQHFVYRRQHVLEVIVFVLSPWNCELNILLNWLGGGGVNILKHGHFIGWRMGYDSYFYRPKIKQKSRKWCTASVAQSTAVEAVAIPSQLAGLNLLLEISTERQVRLLIGYGSPTLR